MRSLNNWDTIIADHTLCYFWDDNLLDGYFGYLLGISEDGYSTDNNTYKHCCVYTDLNKLLGENLEKMLSDHF